MRDLYEACSAMKPMIKKTNYLILITVSLIILLLSTTAVEAFTIFAQQNSVKNDQVQTEIQWTTIAAGVEYATQKIIDNPSAGDGILHIIRIDLAKAKLRSLMVSALDKQPRTAKQWCEEFSLVVVINAGMYDVDHLTHVGYMTSEHHVNNQRWTKHYNSILVFDPLQADLPQAQVLDHASDISDSIHKYGTVIQNLRLIKGNGVNTWKEHPKKWSEAALAMDSQGMVLFLFLQSPLSMYEFNQKILNLPLHISRAMHLEGGPESSLSICSAVKNLHLAGLVGVGPINDGGNYGQWPLPNVIGVFADQPGK